MRILIAEDSPTQAEALRVLLELEGFAVEIARDGQAALERARATHFAIIISDANMPSLSGWELYRALRAGPQTSDTHFLLLSGSDDEGTRARVAEAGIERWLIKPVDLPHLLTILRALPHPRDHAR